MAQRQAAQGAKVPEQPPLSSDQQKVTRAWNLMGGKIEWAALPMLADTLQVRDFESWIEGLRLVETIMSEE